MNYNPTTGDTTMDQAHKLMMEAVKYDKSVPKVRPIKRVRRIEEIGVDTDGDGFSDIVDCQPNNPKKDGPISWIIAKTQGRTHGEVEAERKELKQIEREAETSYRKEMVTQKIEERKEQYQAKKEARLAAIKERYRVKTPEEKLALRKQMFEERQARIANAKVRLQGMGSGLKSTATFLGNMGVRANANRTKTIKPQKTLVNQPLFDPFGMTPLKTNIKRKHKVKHRKAKVKIVYRYKSKPKKARFRWVRKRY